MFDFDKHEQYLPDRNGNKDTFWIGINAKNDFFDMISSPIVLRQGYKTVITVKPAFVDSDTNLLEAVKPVDRKCRYDVEVPENMTMFKKYSMAACKFECMAKYSLDQCLCIPWDLHEYFDEEKV